MPTENTNVLLQDAITNIVESAEQIEQTSEFLKEDIRRVVTHNADHTAHPDIRAELKQVPHTTIIPSISGARTVKTATEYVYTIVSGSLLPDSFITKFSLKTSAGTTDVVDGIVDNQVTVPLTFIGARDEHQQVTVVAYDQNGIASEPYLLEVTIYHNDPPVVTGLICTGLPEYVNPGQAYVFTLEGATDVDLPFGDTLRCFIENSDLSFSSVENVVIGQNLTMTIPMDQVRGSTANFTVRVKDQYDAEAAKVFSIKINQLPVLDNLQHNTPSLMVTGGTHTLRLSGAIDLDGQALTYELTPISPELSFSKTVGITENEAVTMTMADTANHGAIVQYRVTVRDTTGATTSAVLSTQVNTPPNLDALVHDIPAVIKPNQSIVVHLNGAIDVDGNPVVYGISCQDPSLQFDKIADITAGQDVTLTVSSNALRGSNIPIKITAMDSLGSTTDKTITTRINVLPVFPETPITGLPEYVIPGASYPIVFGSPTDSESEQVLQYSVEDLQDATWAKKKNIQANESVSLTIDTDVVRGSTLAFTLTLSDGLESVNKTVSTKVNQLPTILGLVINNLIPVIKPGFTLPVSITGATAPESDQSISYELVSDCENVVPSKTSDIAAGEAIDLVIDSEVVRGTLVTLTVRAHDGYEQTAKAFTFTINQLPVLTGLQHNTPVLMVAGSTYGLQLSGATDPNAQALLYELTPISPELSFSKTSGIAANETVTMTMSAQATYGATLQYRVTVRDNLGESSSAVVTTKVNTPPNLSDLVHDLPDIIKPNQVYALHLSGAIDVDGNPVKYGISCADTSLGFGQLTDINADQEVLMTVAAGALRGSNIVIQISATDSLGSVTTKNITTHINVLPVFPNPIVTGLPAYVIPGETYPVTFKTPLDMEGAQQLTYTVGNIAHATWEKTTGITAEEVVNLTIDSGITRGDTLTFPVTLSDGLETIPGSISTKVNQLATITALNVSGLPAIAKPGCSLPISISGATSPEFDQAITYSLSSSNNKVHPSKPTGIAPGEALNLIVDADAPRGEIITLTVMAYDGYEYSSKTFQMSINRLPLATIEHDIPAIVKPGASYSITITSDDLDDTQTLTYDLECASLNFSKTTGIAFNETLTMMVPSGAVRGSKSTITVTVSDGLESITTTVDVMINSLPVIPDTVITNKPARVKPTGTYSLTFAGATDADPSQVPKYAISSTDTKVSFSKMTNISAGESITMTVGATAVRGSSIPLTVTVTDDLGESTSKTVYTDVNILPVVTGLILDLPTIVKPNQAYTCHLSGATDPDVDQTLVHAITSPTAGITFVNNTDLAPGEAFTIQVGDLARGSAIALSVSTTDGMESVDKAFSSTVNSLPSLVSFSHTVPAIVKPNSSTSIKFNGVTDAQSGQTILCSVVSSDPTNVSFSKSNNIAIGEAINLNIGSGAVRGSTVNLTVTISDGLETVQTIIPVKINSLPSTSLVSTLPAIVAPNTSVPFTLSSTDPDSGQTLTYSVVGTTGLSFSKTSGIGVNESVTLNVGSAVTRGGTGTITVTISDGLETVTATIMVKYNSLPTIPDTILDSIPAILKPGAVYNFSLTGGGSNDSGQTYTYGMTSDNVKAVLSKTTNIADGGALTLTTTSDIPRGTTVTLNVSISDGLETVSKSFTRVINQLPNISSALFNLPALVSPAAATSTFNGVYSGCKVTGITNAEAAQALSFSIACSDPTNVSFSKSSGLAIGEAFSITIGSNAVRGSTLTFTVTVSDGLETIQKTFTVKVNRVPALPTINGLLASIPGGTSLNLNFTSTDADGNTIYFYVALSGLTGLSPAAVGDLLSGQNTSFSFPRVSVSTTIALSVVAYNKILDVNGNALANDWIATKDVTFTVEPVYAVNAPAITSPTAGATLSSDIVNFQISALSTTLLT